MMSEAHRIKESQKISSISLMPFFFFLPPIPSFPDFFLEDHVHFSSRRQCLLHLSLSSSTIRTVQCTLLPVHTIGLHRERVDVGRGRHRQRRVVRQRRQGPPTQVHRRLRPGTTGHHARKDQHPYYWVMYYLVQYALVLLPPSILLRE